MGALSRLKIEHGHREAKEGYGVWGWESTPSLQIGRSLGKISLEKGLMSVFAGLDVNVSRIPRCRHCPQIILSELTPPCTHRAAPPEVNPSTHAYWRASGEPMLKANSRAEDSRHQDRCVNYQPLWLGAEGGKRAWFA